MVTMLLARAGSCSSGVAMRRLNIANSPVVRAAQTRSATLTMISRRHPMISSSTCASPCTGWSLGASPNFVVASQAASVIVRQQPPPLSVSHQVRCLGSSVGNGASSGDVVKYSMGDRVPDDGGAITESARGRIPDGKNHINNGCHGKISLAKVIFGLSVVSIGAWASFLAKSYLDFRDADKMELWSFTFSDYAWYHFTNWFSTDPLAPPFVLSLLVQAIIVSSAIAYTRVGDFVIGEGLWKSWALVVSPDGGVSEAGTAARLVGALTSVAGVVIFALLVSMITSRFQHYMDSLKNSQGPVVEFNHTVLIWWTDKSPAMVRELSLSFASEGGSCIAVLDPRPLVDLREAIRADIGHLDLQGTCVIARSGYSYRETDLKLVSAQSAKSVVIARDPSLPASQSDASAIKKVLALQQRGWPARGKIVVDTTEPANKHLLESLGKGRVEAIYSDDFLARLMVQMTRYKGLGAVFEIVLGFEGSEVYMRHWPELRDCSFGEVAFRFEDAVPFGIKTDKGDVLICPASEYRIGAEDKIIVYADDNDSYHPSAKNCVDMTSRIQDDKSRNALSRKAEKSLIVGWNLLAPDLLLELRRTCASGSSCTVLSELPSDCIRQELQAEEVRWTRHNVETRCPRPLKTEFVVGSGADRSDLEKLPLSSFDNIFLLADVKSWGIGPHWQRPSRLAADAKTVATLFTIKDILQIEDTRKTAEACGSHRNARAGLSVATSQPPSPRFVPEILDGDTARILLSAGITDFIDKNQAVSRNLAMAAEQPENYQVYEALLSPGGCGFHIFGLERYISDGETLPTHVSFWDVVKAVRRVSDDIVVGWILDAKGDCQRPPQTYVNPSNKHEKLLWSTENRLIVIGNA